MTPSQKSRVVVLISGSGSNLQAIIDACKVDEFPAQIVGVVSNKDGAYGLQRAAEAKIETAVLDHTQFASRAEFDQALQTLIDQFNPDLVVLAGFMRILTPELVNHFIGRMLNIHPSLLPKYPGLHTHRRALEAGDAEHGATVHFVTAQLDGGPAVIQARVPVVAGDSEQTLAARVLEQEHLIYPLAVKLVAEGRIELKADEVLFDANPLPQSGLAASSLLES